MGADTEAIRCARHPNIETGLACGRCGTPICPRCMVMTDVGARCPTCAPRRKLPQFEISPLFLLQGLATALVAGAAVGAAWGLILPDGTLGLLLAFFLGVGVGYAVAEPVSLATNRKLGVPLQIAAALGVGLAYLVRNLVAGDGLLPSGDIDGYIATAVAIVVAINRLR